MKRVAKKGNRKSTKQQGGPKGEKLPNGATIHWGDRNPKRSARIAFTCADCGLKRYAWDATVNYPNWMGRCHHCRGLRAHPNKFTDDEKHPSGATFHWSERSPENLNKVAFTCVGCGLKKFSWRHNFERERWTGLCAECVDGRIPPHKRTDDMKHASGAMVHWGDRHLENGDKVGFTCRSCKHKTYIWDTYVYKASWAGLCKKCNPVLRRGHRPKFTHDEEHPSGAVIKWGDRSPESRHKVAFICQGCKEKSYKWTPDIKRPTWSGLCLTCREQRTDPRKFTQDEVLKSKSIIHWGEGDSKFVPVTCGKKKCQLKRLMSRQSVYGKHSRPSWTGYCANHRNLTSQLVNPIGRKANDKKKLLLEAEQAVATIWEQVQVRDIPLERQVKRVTEIAVASALGLGMEGADVSADQLRKRLAVCGVKEKFPNERWWVRAWIKSIVERIEYEKETGKN